MRNKIRKSKALPEQNTNVGVGGLKGMLMRLVPVTVCSIKGTNTFCVYPCTVLECSVGSTCFTEMNQKTYSSLKVLLCSNYSTLTSRTGKN